MPELPEVETVVAGLRAGLLKKTITNIYWSGKKMRQPIAVGGEKTLQKNWVGRKITAIDRRAKYIIITGQRDGDSRYLLCHLGMSGFIRLINKNDPAWRDWQTSIKHLRPMMIKTHLHILARLNNGVMAFYDPRRFGFIADVAGDDLIHHPALTILGHEPLTLTRVQLIACLEKYNLSMKAFLLNQKAIVGIGNIYAAEILWRAAIDPRRKTATLKDNDIKKLLSSIKFILRQAIKKGGSSFSDFQNPAGELGYFSHQWQVYERAGQPCRWCGGLIKKTLQNNRTTYYCDSHQR